MMEVDSIENIKFNIDKNLALLEAIEAVTDESGISRVSQKALANQLDVSPSLISKRLKFLIDNGAVVKIKSGQYRVINKAIVDKLFEEVLAILIFVTKERPELIHNYKKQSEELNIEYSNVQKAWGYINYTAAKKLTD